MQIKCDVTSTPLGGDGSESSLLLSACHRARNWNVDNEKEVGMLIMKGKLEY